MISNERGMTLTELLMAIFIITVGLIAIATGMQLATSSINVGQQETTASFLAEHKLEDIKAFALVDPLKDPSQGFSNVTSANFPAEAYNSIASFGSYRRATTISNPSATVKVVVVNVFYFPVGVASTSAERQVTLSTALRQR
jgi:prepilin-type N-terminal cleavage/methylation domain-containing protein